MSVFRSKPVRPVLTGLVAVMMVGGVTAGSTPAGAAPKAARQAVRPATAPIGKPVGPLDVDLRSAGSGHAVLHASAQPGVASVVIRVSGTGQASATGSTTSAVGPTGQVTAPVSYAVSGGGAGSVVASVRALDAAGRTIVQRSDVLYVRSSYGQLIASQQGTLDLGLQDLARGHELGKLSDTSYAKARDALQGGGAAQRITIGKTTASPSVAGMVTAAGQVRWTDSVGTTHPVRSATVQIRDAEASGSVLVSSVLTNDSGNYTSTFDNNDGAGEGGRDIFVVVYARGPGFLVNAVSGLLQRIQSTVTNNVADGASLSINLTANNTADNNTAFAVQDALTTVNRYVKVVNGALLPNINVIFPTDQGGSFFNGTVIHLLQLDRFDQDVIGHEFGHYVQSQLGITENPGGQHSFGVNDAETLGKSDGIRIAWGEGWPTYFAITAQLQQNVAAQNIPNAGDTRYTDTEDSSLDVSAETNTGPADVGEDDELSSIRILFDVFDSASDTGDDRGISLGDQAVWDLVTNSHSVTLNDFYNAAVAGKTLQQVADYGCIFGENKVAPVITSPANSTAPASPPTITWVRNGLGPSFRNNQFNVKYYNASSNTLLFTSPVVTGTSYTPNQSQWDAILGDSGNKIEVAVSGGNNAAPATGPYTSCNVELTQPK